MKWFVTITFSLVFIGLCITAILGDDKVFWVAGTVFVAGCYFVPFVIREDG